MCTSFRLKHLWNHHSSTAVEHNLNTIRVGVHDEGRIWSLRTAHMSSGCSCYSCVCVLLLWFQKSHFPHSSRLKECGSALLLLRKLSFSLEFINKFSVILDSKGLKMWGSLWSQRGTSGTSRLQPWHQQEVPLTKSSCWFVKNLLFKPPPNFSDQSIVGVLKTSFMGSTLGFLNAVLFKKSASSPSCSSTSTSRMEVYILWCIH